MRAVGLLRERVGAVLQAVAAFEQIVLQQVVGIGHSVGLVTVDLQGVAIEDKGVLRNHQRVIAGGAGEGEITSGGFSPTIGRSIALARVPAGDYDRAQVDVRGKLLNVRIVPTPFVRNGKIRIEGEID